MNQLRAKRLTLARSNGHSPRWRTREFEKRRRRPFGGWTAAKHRLDGETAALAGPGTPAPLPWGLHDLRRTFSTIMHDRALADPHIIEAVLAHRAGQSGVAGVYNRAAYRDAKRTALEAWAEVVGEIAAGANDAAQ